MYRTLLKEKKEAGLISEDYEKSLENKIKEMANIVFEHEKIIIGKIFSKGKIEGITDVQLEHFVQSRINLCLRNLGYSNLFKVEYNPIAEWFYKGINGYQQQDFFSSQGNQYGRNWNEKSFIWSGE